MTRDVIRSCRGPVHFPGILFKPSSYPKPLYRQQFERASLFGHVTWPNRFWTYNLDRNFVSYVKFLLCDLREQEWLEIPKLCFYLVISFDITLADNDRPSSFVTYRVGSYPPYPTHSYGVQLNNTGLYFSLINRISFCGYRCLNLIGISLQSLILE